MYYVGLDVHARQSSFCVLDENGREFRQFQVKGNWQAMLKEAEKLPRPFALCYEASCGYGYLHEQFSPMAEHVAVAHPGQLRMIFRSKKKNDRVDARKLAKLLYLQEVPQVHVPGTDVRQWRAIIEFRQTLVGRRAGVKNQVRALLRGLGIVPPKGLWARKGLAWLGTVELKSLDAVRRDVMLDELMTLSQQIKRVEKELDAIAKDQPGVTLLRTIPGIGPRTAEAVVAYIDDPKRFAKANQFGAYFGLVPCQDASGGTNRLGHITRDGPATVRKLLCESCWQGVYRSAKLKRYFEKVSGGDPKRRKIALVATARHLVTIMGVMLKTGEAWREED